MVVDPETPGIWIGFDVPEQDRAVYLQVAIDVRRQFGRAPEIDRPADLRLRRFESQSIKFAIAHQMSPDLDSDQVAQPYRAGGQKADDEAVARLHRRPAVQRSVLGFLKQAQPELEQGMRIDDAGVLVAGRE